MIIGKNSEHMDITFHLIVSSSTFHPPSAQFHDVSMSSAANYLSKHAMGVKSVYVRAVATYALTLHDPNGFKTSELLNSLENLAREKGVCAL